MQTAQRSEEKPGDQDAANVTVGDSPSTNAGLLRKPIGGC